MRTHGPAGARLTYAACVLGCRSDERKVDGAIANGVRSGARLRATIAWLLIAAALIAAAVAGRVPAIVLAVGYQLFWRMQYAGHRRQVKRHFAQPQLKPGF